MKKACIECGFSVGNGGNRHATGTCPPKPKSARAASNQEMGRQRKQQAGAQSALPKRGEPAAGVRKDRSKHKGHGGGAG